VAILGLLPVYFAFFPTKQTPATPSPPSEATAPPAPLQLVSFRVASGVDVDALVSDFEGHDEKQKFKVASLIDLTIKNVSNDSLVLTDAVFEVAGQPLKQCQAAGGPLSFTGLYDVVLPASPAQLPSVIHKQLTHKSIHMMLNDSRSKSDHARSLRVNSPCSIMSASHCNTIQRASRLGLVLPSS
jgi:hypothetical protein